MRKNDNETNLSIFLAADEKMSSVYCKSGRNAIPSIPNKHLLGTVCMIQESCTASP